MFLQEQRETKQETEYQLGPGPGRGNWAAGSGGGLRIDTSQRFVLYLAFVISCFKCASLF